MDKRNKNETFSVEENKEESKTKNKIGSPKSNKNNLKKDMFILSPKLFGKIKEELAKNKNNDLNIENIDENDEEIRELFDALQNQKKNNNEFINNYILPLFKNTNLKEFLKSDLLFTSLDIIDLINYLSSFITLKKYKQNEIIYSYNEPAENIYLILRGTIGLYKLVETEEMFTSDEYYFYLYSKYYQYKQIIFKENEKINSDNNEFIDIDLLINNINNNKHIFPFHNIEDILDINKIILLIKIYILFLENKARNTHELFKKFNIPMSYLNYDKFIKRKISFSQFMEELSKNMKEKEKFYMKYLSKDEKYKIKIVKFVKYQNLNRDNYFGNFEIIDTKPLRKDYAISENPENTILLAINKKEYSKIANKSRKEKRKKEIDFLHDNFFFKTINRHYFETKVYIKYKIDQFSPGHILSNQGEKMHNFIFIEEGVIQSAINDISLLEFPDKIKSLYDFIIKKAKDLNEDPKEIIDFDIKLNQKTNLKYDLIKDALKQKQNFTISKTVKGMIGDYEYYFRIPSFITSTVISKNNRIFFYDFLNFKKVNEETHAFNEILKRISFYKLKSILKRMVAIYNSYFAYTMKEIENKIKDNSNMLITEANRLNIHNSIENEKNFSSPINKFRKRSININNFINTLNIINTINIMNATNENHNSRYILETQNSNHNNNLNNYFSKSRNTGKSLYNIKHHHNINDSEKKNQNLKLISSHNRYLFNRNMTLFNNSIDNTLKTKMKKRLCNKKLIFNKFLTITNNQISKNSSSANTDSKKNIKNNELSKNKILDVFLPPLLDKKENSRKESKSLKINLKNSVIRHTFETINSINSVSLGHKDKNNLDEPCLTNYNFKKTKDSKSLDIKKAQILLLKTRDKKAKLIAKKRNELELDYFIYEEIF